MSEFSELTSLLADWPSEIPSTPFADPPLERLRGALVSLRHEPESVGPGDLAGLISHVLRRQACREPNAELLVPRASSHWPSEQRWEASGLTLVGKPVDRFRLVAGPTWTPRWLPGSKDAPPLDDVLRETPLRNEHPDSRPVLDPCLAAVLGPGFETFTGPGQREAVRAAFLLPAEKTALVLLPTGSGKSLVAWAPALLGWPARGLTLVLVPTTALALDQERQIRPHLHRLGVPLRTPLAWHGQLAEEDRTAIRSAIRDGTQPILFASPEGVLRALSPALFDAAESGLLRALVLDEAHMVAQWGTDFRPEFQTLAGVRRELTKVCPDHAKFRTVLLTATLTQDGYDTLAQLFGPLELIAAVHLRPEPSYWVAHAPTVLDQTEWVLEACRQMPRPFLLYVTQRKQAERWANHLREDGLCRVRFMHGQSNDRSEVLDLWRANAIDVVVATSAFGLGMDKRDVRAVIHACVPETLDRFYQEVGRGGRDGRACLSLMVHTDKNLDVAKRLNSERVISVELGFERWKAMLQSVPSDQLTQSELTLDLNARRPDITSDNDANVGWNLMTLNLMARAGFLELHGVRPPVVKRQPGEDDASFQARRDQAFDDYFTSTRVRILEPGHRDLATWQDRIEEERSRTQEAAERQLVLLDELLAQEAEFAGLLVDAYALEVESGLITLQEVCAGCPHCRETGDDLREYAVPHPEPPEPFDSAETTRRLRAALHLSPTARTAVVTYHPPGTHRRHRRRWTDTVLSVLLPRCVERGICEVSVSPRWADRDEFARLAPSRYVLYTPTDEEEMPEWYVPRLTLLDPDDATAERFGRMLNSSRPLHVILVPEGTPDPRRPESPYSERNTVQSLTSFLEELDR